MCPDGQTNVDELDLVDITDCHIKTVNIRIMYGVVVGLAVVLFCISSKKLYPSFKSGTLNLRHIPHNMLFGWMLHSILFMFTFIYKFIAIAPMAGQDTVVLVLHSFTATFWFSSLWTFVYYLIVISVSDEMGKRGGNC